MASHKSKVVGGTKNFWIWSEDDGFDLTHPPEPTSPPVYPRIPLATKKDRIAIDPIKTALVIVDMQNYFLSPLLGRPSNGVGLRVVDELLKHAIPACRKADIPIVWLGWGLTADDIDEMPPSIIGTLGEDMGQLKLDNGTVIEAGPVMMCDEWNTAFYPRLVEAAKPQDIWIYKNRLSGFWGVTGIEEALKSRGIRTLLFAEENTDQCIASSMQDAYTKGWDCLMLSDGCGTTSPNFATKCIEFNCENWWGFVLPCQQVADGVDNMQIAPEMDAEPYPKSQLTSVLSF